MGNTSCDLNDDNNVEDSQSEFKKIPPPSSITYINTKDLSNSTITCSGYASTGYTSATLYTQSCPITPFSPWSKDRIAQRVISDQIIELCLNFWRKNIHALSMEDRLELGCSIFFLTNTTTQQILKKNCKTPQKLESVGLKYLDMIEYAIRSAAANRGNVNSDLLLQLGQLHDAMGVTAECYVAMLKQTHDVFQFYFPIQYTEEVRFAFDEMFTYITFQMTGIDLKIISPLQNTYFLRSLRECIKSDIGRQLLFRFLHQVYCDEIVIFLQLITKYKSETDDRIKFLIAKDILRICIDFEGIFAINISYECRQQIIQTIQECEKQFEDYDIEFVMDMEFLVDAEDQMCRLIMQTHWKKFKQIIHNSCDKEF
eukprot:10202_1